MGDHGESLGEHGEATHGFFVYTARSTCPAVRAPFPSTSSGASPIRAQRRRDADGARAARDSPPSISGVSLVPLMTGAKKELGLAAYSEAMYPRFHFGWSDLRALTSGRYK